MEEITALAWKILEYKCIYYHFNGAHPDAIPDYDYDILEKRYDKLCADNGIDPTASDMIDFDSERPSCQLVICKLSGILPDHIRAGHPHYESMDVAAVKMNDRLTNYKRGLKPLPPEEVEEEIVKPVASTRRRRRRK
jgi:hypothetical protein